jgi:hypothetical protein
MRDDGVGYVCNWDRDVYIIMYEGQHNNVRLELLPRGKSRCLFVSDESGVKTKGERRRRRMIRRREIEVNTAGRAAKQIVVK